MLHAHPLHHYYNTAPRRSAAFGLDSISLRKPRKLSLPYSCLNVLLFSLGFHLYKNKSLLLKESCSDWKWVEQVPSREKTELERLTLRDDRASIVFRSRFCHW